MVTLVLGGARSGKSEVAERLVARLPAPTTYIATADVTGDDDLIARVAVHRDRRPLEWKTIEARLDLVTAVASVRSGTLLLDSLGPWVAAHTDFVVDANALVDAVNRHRGDVVIVSEEVGLGVHPSSEIGRRFRDALGDVNQAIACVADEVLLVVAGRVLPLDPMPRETES
jgi:adenosyl cobinamide kinase/adenosyl cobinamide phosphate guanylyltransferase